MTSLYAFASITGQRRDLDAVTTPEGRKDALDEITGDFLCDLLHLCDRENLDFDELLERARGYYEEECDDEADDEDDEEDGEHDEEREEFRDERRDEVAFYDNIVIELWYALHLAAEGDSIVRAAYMVLVVKE